MLEAPGGIESDIAKPDGLSLMSTSQDSADHTDSSLRSMAYLKLLLAVFSVALVSGLAEARSEIILETDSAVIEAAPYLEILEDPDAVYGEADLFAPAFNARFQPMERASANFGFSGSDWWVRYRVDNMSGIDQTVSSLLDYPLLDYVDVWVVRGDALSDAWQTGNRRPFVSRPIEYRSFLFPIQMAAGERVTVYMRVRSEGPINIGLSLYGENSILPKVSLEYMGFGAYFGSFLLLAVAITLLFLIDRQAAFLYYLIYILSYSSYMLTFNGLAFQYLWPGDPTFGQVIRPILLTLSLIFLLQFSHSLLGIKDISRTLYRGVVGLQVLLVAVLIGALSISYGAFVAPMAVLTLIAMLVVITMGVVAQRRGEAAAKYYLLGWSVFLIGVLLYLLKVFALLPHNFLTHFGFQIGSFFEFVFLSLALGVRVRELRRLSRVDALTGLPNRRLFDLALAEEISLSERLNAELSLLVIDVDHFKRFNDQHGHAAGDRALQELAKVFQKKIRRPASAYRYGGEEFAVILPRTNGENALKIAERLRESAASEVSFDGVTISIGLVTRSLGILSDPTAFFEAGDQALYKAKKAGRNQVRAHEHDMSGAGIVAPARSPQPGFRQWHRKFLP